MPLELLATTPPIVQATSLAGSGPSLRLNLASDVLTARTVAPGLTETTSPFSPTLIPRKFLRVSTKNPSLLAWPLRLVPPDLKVTPIPSSVAIEKISASCSLVSGV
jgi:hypothetical protein